MVNKNKSALFKECLYMVLNSNNLWALAAEQWVFEGQASPTVGSRINGAVGGPKMGHGGDLQRLLTIYHQKARSLWVFSA